VTSDASGKLATKSRSWAAEVRASLGSDDAAAETKAADAGPAADVTPPTTSDGGSTPTDGPTSA
jgi:hypothetical protein